MLHQATLAAGSIVPVNDAACSSLVNDADSLQNSFFCSRSIVLQSRTGLSDGCAGRAAQIAIAQSALLVLFVPFDLRLNVSQGLPPKNFLPV